MGILSYVFPNLKVKKALEEMGNHTQHYKARRVCIFIANIAFIKTIHTVKSLI